MTHKHIDSTISSIRIEYDLAKNKRNIKERGLSFDLARQFDFESAVIKQDIRQDYGEIRYQALGLIDRRVYFIAFSIRNYAIRVISLRKANFREVRFYEQNTKP